MSGDFSRLTFDAARHYDGVLLQQGRVQLDSDWNEQVAITTHLRETSLRDIIGASGVPRANPGFELVAMGALVFDGVDDSLALTPDGSLATAPPATWCIELSVLRGAGGQGGTLVSSRANHNEESARAWTLSVTAEGTLSLQLVEDGSSDAALVSSSPLESGDWTHVALAADADRATLYVDGQIVGESDWPGRNVVLLPPSVVGAAATQDPRGDFFDGAFEEVRVWDRPRPLADLRADQHRLLQRDAPGLVLYWLFPTPAGSDWSVEDASGHGNHAVWPTDEAHRPTWTFRDVLATAGRIYVDGIACDNDRPIGLLRQPETAASNLPGQGSAVIYLDVWKRLVTRHEDPSIHEVALGIADTAVREQVRWRLAALPLGDAHRDGHDERARYEWEAFVGSVRASGRLSARRNPDMAGDPGNQLYRIEIYDGSIGNGPATFTWSRENACLVFEVQSFDAATGTAIVDELGPDDLTLREGDLLEVIADAAVDGRGPLARVSHLERGSRRIVLADVEGVRLDPAQRPLLRRWDHGRDHTELLGGAVPMQPGTWQTLEDGLEVRFDSSGGYRAGDYWQIPVREAQWELDWPRDGFEPRAELPNGVQHHYCPLGLLVVEDGTPRIRDLRRPFASLTELAGDTSERVRTTGDAMTGPLRINSTLWVSGDVHLGGRVNVGALAPSTVGSHQLVDGSVTREKLAPDLNLVPRGFAILGTSTEEPPGFVSTGLSLSVDEPRWRRRVGMGGIGEVTAVNLYGRIFLFSESGSLRSYDPRADEVYEHARLRPDRRDAATAALGGKLYVIGGTNYEGHAMSDVSEFDPELNRWVRRRPLAEGRSSVGLVAHSGGLHAVGGRGDGRFGGVALTTHEVYAPDADMWYPRAALRHPRQGVAVVQLEGRVFAIGGEHTGTALQHWSTVPSANVEAYDHTRDRWHECAPLLAPRRGLAAVADGLELLVLGGEPTNGAAAARYTPRARYDPGVDAWLELSPLPGVRGSVSLVWLHHVLYAVRIDPLDAAAALVERLSTRLFIHVRRD